MWLVHNNTGLLIEPRIFDRKYYVCPRYSKACCSAIAYAKGLTRYSIAHAKKQFPLWSRAETLGVGAATALLFFCHAKLLMPEHFHHRGEICDGVHDPTIHDETAAQPSEVDARHPV